MADSRKNVTIIAGHKREPTYGPNRPWQVIAQYNQSDIHFKMQEGPLEELRDTSTTVLFNGLVALMSPQALDLLECLARRKQRHLIYLHDIDWCYAAYCRYFSREAERLRAVDKSFTYFPALSENQSAFIRRTFSVPREHIRITGVTSPVRAPDDYKPRRPDPTALRFGTVASIQPRKGADFFVEAAIRVCMRHPGISFHWYGRPYLDPTYYVELQRHIDRSGLHDRIVFHGHVHDTEQCYYGFDVLLLPSRDDPFPLCVLEAMSFGKLCMGFDSGGFIEQVGDTGMPVRPMSAEALAAACMRVIHEPALLARGQKAQARYAAEHHPRVFTRRMVEAVKTMCT